jgi:tetratricopeptide (TPR) repeat protein
VRGIEMVKLALAINPASPGWAFTPLAYDAYRRGDFEMALTFVDDMKMPAYFRTYVLKAQILSAMGDYDAAHNALQEALALKPEFASRPREFMEHWGLERGMIERSLDDLAKAGLTNPS